MIKGTDYRDPDTADDASDDTDANNSETDKAKSRDGTISGSH